MKINFLAPHLKIGGGTRVIFTYADLLARRGHKVIVLVQTANLFKRISANALGKKPSWLKGCASRILYVSNFSEKHLPDADVTIATAWQTANWANSYLGRLGRKFYFIQHDERLYHGPLEEVEKTYRLPLKKIVVSSWLKEIMQKDFGEESFLLLNSFDRKIFYKTTKRREDRNIIRILLMHHSYEWKGTKEGVEIIQELKGKYQNIKLIMFGARQKKIEYACDEYYYNPAQKDLAEIYSSCDIFLCPSWDEGFGLPSLEAMACGCALVTYDNGGSRDFAFDGQTAMVAERRNINDLASKLEKLVLDEKLRIIIAANGYQLALKWPTWEEQTKKLEEILKTA